MSIVNPRLDDTGPGSAVATWNSNEGPPIADLSMPIVMMAKESVNRAYETTLAEGVENEEQLEILRHYGCDYIQGYYYSKPMPADEMTEYLRSLE